MKLPPAPLRVSFTLQLAILNFTARSLMDLVCGPLNPTRIILPFLCSPNYTHTHTHTHRCTEALKGGPWQNPHHPCDLCPSPLTWLSNYRIDYAATTTLPSTFTTLIFFPILKTSLLVFCCRSATTGGQMDTSRTTFQTVWLNLPQIVDWSEPQAGPGSTGGLHDSITLPPSLCVWLL